MSIRGEIVPPTWPTCASTLFYDNFALTRSAPRLNAAERNYHIAGNTLEVRNIFWFAGFAGIRAVDRPSHPSAALCDESDLGIVGCVFGSTGASRASN